VAEKAIRCRYGSRRIVIRYLRLFILFFGISIIAHAQDRKESTNSLFDGAELKVLNPKSILIQGEVQNPGPVDLASLPIGSIAIKEMALENGQRVFKGAYFINGYSLYDILKSKNFKKAPENTFGSPVDLYISVENEKGEKAAFSWGEIYYRNSFDILISKTIQPITPARAKVSYALPETPRLICGGDLLNVRFISNPTKITVRSYNILSVPKEKLKDIYAPELMVRIPMNRMNLKAIHMGFGADTVKTPMGERTVATQEGTVLWTDHRIYDIGSSIEKRTYTDVGYGHGMGFKGNENISGYLLKDVLAKSFTPTLEMLKEWIAIGSAKDGYRVVLSLSEIMNRNDNQDFLLIDKKDTPGIGRYMLYPAGDFFADRDVRAIETLVLSGIE
jgi:hypothetical protein